MSAADCISMDDPYMGHPHNEWEEIYPEANKEYEFIEVETDDSDDEEHTDSAKLFEGVRPTWQPDNSTNNCKRCKQAFSFIRRRHHCRFCGHIFCYECCRIKASYPPWYGYETPQRVCEECIPILFSSRRSIDTNAPIENEKEQTAKRLWAKAVRALSKQPSLEKVTTNQSNLLTSRSSVSLNNSKITEDGSFHTSGTEIVSLPLRALHPITKVAFWISGMYEGGNFDRSLLETAASLNLPFVTEPVKKIVRDCVPVPDKWPDYPISSDDLHLYGESNQDLVYAQSIPVVIFTPLHGHPPYPILVWYHGGGFCLGSADNLVYHTICRSLANRAGCVVVSVEYRLAPEYKFPTQVEDSYAALEWAWSRASRFQGDPTRIAVGGDSAGGSLAAVVSILVRDRNPSIHLAHQLLVYPCITDPRTNDIKSHVDYINGPVLSRDVCLWFMRQVFADLDHGLNHPLAMPLKIKSHHNLPPATIINALHDPLCDHGMLYANKLRECGVHVVRSVYRKSLHGFFGSSIGESDEAVAEAATALRFAYAHVQDLLKKQEEEEDDE